MKYRREIQPRSYGPRLFDDPKDGFDAFGSGMEDGWRDVKRGARWLFGTCAGALVIYALMIVFAVYIFDPRLP